MDKLIEQFNDIQINKKNIKNVRCDGLQLLIKIILIYNEYY